jgi:ribosomal protein S18 acetylase RimI-like enzyme
MSDVVVIRNYCSKDLESCRSLWRELTQWHRLLYDDPSIGGKHPEKFFDKHLARVGKDYLWVAVINTNIVGLTGLILDGEEAEIEPLIVSQPYRYRGIGTKLLDTAISEAQLKGAKILSVKPVIRNLKAIQFFHKQKFRNLGCIELFIPLSEKKFKKKMEIFDITFNY